MKKGATFSNVMFVILAAIVLIFLITNAYGSVIEAVKADAFLTNENIVGVINVMQSATNTTYHEIKLPKTDCIITVDQTKVNVTMKYNKENITSIKYLIDTNMTIVPNIIRCKDREEVVITVKNLDNKIYVE